MYGKNTLDKIYLTQKKLLPHPSTYQRRNSSFFQGRIAIPYEAKRQIVIRPYCSPLTVHCSLLSALCSLTPAH